MKKIISVLFFCLLLFACKWGKNGEDRLAQIPVADLPSGEVVHAATAPTATASVVAPVPATDVVDVVITYRVKRWGNYYYADSPRIGKIIADELTQKVGLKRVEVFDTANSTLPATTVGKFLVEDTGEQVAAGFILKVHWQPTKGAPQDYDIVLYYKNDKMSAELWREVLGGLFLPNPRFEVQMTEDFDGGEYVPICNTGEVYYIYNGGKNISLFTPGAVYELKRGDRLISRRPLSVLVVNKGDGYEKELTFSPLQQIAMR